MTFINFIIVLKAYTLILHTLWRFQHGEENESPLSFLEVVRRSVYYTAMLLIASYFLCMLIPGVLLFVFHDGLEEEDGNFDRNNFTVRTNTLYLITCLSDTVDTYIYIFKYSPVRELLLRKYLVIRAHLTCCHNTVHVGVETNIPGANEVALVANNEPKQSRSIPADLEQRCSHLNTGAAVINAIPPSDQNKSTDIWENMQCFGSTTMAWSSTRQTSSRGICEPSPMIPE